MRYAIIIGVLLIAAPLLLRIHNPEPYPDAESYEQLASHGHSLSDYLYKLVPGQLVLLLCAALSLILIGFVYDDEFFLALLVASPVFIKTFTTAGPAAPALLIISLGVLLAHKQQYWSVLTIPLAFSFSFSLGVLATITLIVVAIARNLPFIALGASFFALLSATITGFLTTSFSVGFVATGWNDYLGVIAGSQGVTIFLLFLGLLGFLIQLRENPRPSQFVALLIIPCSVFFEHGLIILAAFLAFYGSKALRFLTTRQWHFEELRSITLLLIACGILFSVVIEEKDRIAVHTERVALVKFIQAAYPTDARVVAPADVAPILRYKGYAADTLTDASTVQATQGYAATITDKLLPGNLVPEYVNKYYVYEMDTNAYK